MLLTVGQVCSSKSIDLHSRRGRGIGVVVVVVGGRREGVHTRRRIWSDGTNHFWHSRAPQVKSNLRTPFQGIWNEGGVCPRRSPDSVTLAPLESALTSGAMCNPGVSHLSLRGFFCFFFSFREVKTAGANEPSARTSVRCSRLVGAETLPPFSFDNVQQFKNNDD